SGTVTLASPVEFEIGKRLLLGNLLLLDDGVPLLRAHGHVEPTGAVDFEVKLDSLDLADLQDFSGLEALKGSLSLNGSLTGTSPVTVRDDSIAARLESHRFDLSWFQPLISPRVARELKGWFDGTVTVGGVAQQPSVSGHLALSEGRVSLPLLGVEFKKGEAALAFSGQTIRLERARIESGGAFDATGTATLLGRGQSNMDLDARFRRFVPVNTAQAKAELDGGFQVSGDLRAPRVRGEVTVNRATLYAEKGEATNVEPVQLSARDRLDLQERFGVGVGARTAERASAGDSVDLD